MGDAGQQASEAANNLQKNAADTTNAAVAQGQNDVQSLTDPSTTAGYVEKAKGVAGTVLSTAQGYVQAAGERIAPADPNAPGIVNTLQATAASTLTAGAQYIGSAHAAVTGADSQQVADNINQAASSTTQTVRSAVGSAHDSAKPYVDSAHQKASDVVGAAQGHGNQAATASRDTYDQAKSTASDAYDNAASTAKDYTNKASVTAQSGYGQAKDFTGNTYDNTASTAYSTADDTATRARDLKQNAAEGVNAYLRMGEKDSNVTNT